MVDPVNFTNYQRNDCELEEAILFGVLVAGKTAAKIVVSLENILSSLEGSSPFVKLQRFSVPELEQLLLKNGVGCYTLKARAVYSLVHSGINLRTCSIEDLEKIVGIGPKTSRLFILHTRKDVQVACLDTHILKEMRLLGYEVPKSTPGNKKQYRRIELLFIELAKQQNRDIAEYDLALWNKYSRKPK